MFAASKAKTPARKRETTTTLPIPSQFGCYIILEHLGRGGMGDVYKARHLEMDRLVALKVLSTSLSSPEFLERFNSEALAISRLQHQNIVTIYDYGDIDFHKYIAMQFIKGKTLAKIIEKENSLSHDRIINIGKQICRGIKYAHEQNVIHRDVKTGNIMVDSAGRAYLSDFGIAQIPGAARLTTTGMAVGTPEYMSPEQCEGKALDNQCDIYSLGIVLYEMAAGKPPFLADNPLAVAYKHVHESAPLLSKVRPGIPPSLEMIIAKCLKKDKKERYKNADELLNDMDTVTISLPRPQLGLGGFFKTGRPREKRITDRRRPERRASFPRKLLLLSALLALVPAGLLAVVFLAKSPGSGGISWIKPSVLQIIKSDNTSYMDSELKSLFDGKARTGWPVLSAHVASTRLMLAFEDYKLIKGISLQASLPPGDEAVGEKDSLAAAIEVLANGKLQRSFNLLGKSLPQYFDLKPFIAGEITLVFSRLQASPEEALQEAPDLVISEIKILGLPYRE